MVVGRNSLFMKEKTENVFASGQAGSGIWEADETLVLTPELDINTPCALMHNTGEEIPILSSLNICEKA